MDTWADCTQEKSTNRVGALAANVGMFLLAVSEQAHKSGWQRCKQKTKRGDGKKAELFLYYPTQSVRSGRCTQANSEANVSKLASTMWSCRKVSAHRWFTLMNSICQSFSEDYIKLDIILLVSISALPETDHIFLSQSGKTSAAISINYISQWHQWESKTPDTDGFSEYLYSSDTNFAFSATVKQKSGIFSKMDGLISPPTLIRFTECCPTWLLQITEMCQICKTWLSEDGGAVVTGLMIHAAFQVIVLSRSLF